MLKKIISTVLVMTMALSIAACGKTTTPAATSSSAPSASATPAPAGKAFKMGAYLQLTGGNSAVGLEADNSIKLAVKNINAQGGFNGQQIDYIPYDTQGSAEEAVKVVTKMIETDKVDSVIGSINSSEVLAAAGYLNDAKIFNFGLGTSSTWMKKDWPYVFRASFNNDFGAPTYAKMIKEDLGLKKVAVFYGQDDSSLSNGKTCVRVFTEAGLEVVAEETYDSGDVDYTAQVRNIINSGAEAIYFVVIANDAPLFVKQMRQNGYNGLLFDKDTFFVSQREIAGVEASNYIASVVPYVTYNALEDSDIEIMSNFLKQYKEEYKVLPKTECAYRAWDTMMVFWEATKIAGSNDSEALKKATATIKGFEGLGGTFDYTTGDREGLHILNAFIQIEGKNTRWDTWLKDGGYEAYKAATGSKY